MKNMKLTKEKRYEIERKFEDLFVELASAVDKKDKTIGLFSGIDRASMTCINAYLDEIQGRYDNSNT